MEIIYKNPKDLIPYEKNTKIHDKTQIDNVAESIKQFGFVQPVVIDKDNVIVIGHCRTLAAKKLKMETVPCVLVDTLTEEQIRALRIVDNKTNESPWEMDFLKDELKDIDLLGFDFDFGFEDDEPDTDIIEDVAPEVDEEAEPKAKLGQIYKLGNHRLMCGDSTKEEDVKALMDGAEASLLLTDPPYNVAIGDKNKMLKEVDKASKRNPITKNIEGDAGYTDIEQRINLWKPAFEAAFTVCNDKCAVYSFMPQGGAHMMMMMMSIQEAGWQVKHELIWVKNIATFSMGRLDYDYQHEPILYGWNKTHEFYAKEHQTSIIDDNVDIDKLTKEQLKEILKNIINKETSVLRENKPMKCDLHPTMKPLALLARLIKNSSRQGDNVLDIFGGSGSTLITCEQMNRNCYMMEYDPHYVDVIIERWENFTGQKAELIK